MDQIVTVTGTISPEQLGITMSHVHLICNILFGGAEPPKEASKRKLSEATITMDILGLLRRDATLVKANMILEDVDEAISTTNFEEQDTS